MESITLQTNDSIVSSGDLLGQLQFAASSESDGGASRLVVAKVYAQGEGAFSASSNPASIVFATSSSDDLAATGRIKVDDNGNLLPLENYQYSIGRSGLAFNNLYANSGYFSSLQVNGVNVSVSGHTHISSQITDFNESVDDRVNSLLVQGTGVQITYNDSGNTLRLDNLHSEINILSQEPQGFVNRLDSLLSFNDSTRTFTIQPSGSSYDIYIEGVKVTKTGVESVVIDTGTALNYIHFDTDTQQLQTKTSAFDFNTDVPVAFIHWNKDINQSTFFGEERHGIRMDSSTHRWIHNTFGMQYIDGLSVSNYTLLGDGSSNSHAQIAISDGTLYQEDIIITIADGDNGVEFTQQLSPTGYFPVYYHSGITGQWVRDSGTPYPVKYNATRALYNVYTTGIWTLQNVTNNRYFAMWLVATNDINDPILAIMGQREDSSLGSAESNNNWSDIDLTNIPTNEIRPLYRLIFNTNDTYANTPKSSLQSILDLRSTNLTVTYGVPQNDHGNLFGLADDDHTQYVHINNSRTISANHTFTNGLTISSGLLSATSGNFTSLTVNSTGVSLSGHTHTAANITDFNSAVSGLVSGIYASGNGIVSHIAYWSSTNGLTSDSGQLYWDATNNRLGVGTVSPTDMIDVSGTLRVRTLNTASGNFVTTNSSGVLQQRTASQVLSDLTAVTGVGTSGYVARWISNSGLNSGILYDDATNVGIGTTTPSGKIDVRGNSYFGSPSTANSLYLRTGQSGISETALRLRTDTSSNLYLDAGNASVKVGNQSADVIISAGNGPVTIGNSATQTVANQYVRFTPANIERMRIDGTGNVGIGNASPSYRLDVTGTGNFTGDVRATGSFIGGSGTAALPSFEFVNDPDTGLFSPATNTFAISTSGTERLRIDNIGNVGIGTTAPSGKLHVVGTGLFASTTGLSPNGLLSVYSTSSGATLFSVEGTNGNLFSVIDSTSGSLMSVNDITGLGAFEVFSDHSIVAGRYNQNDFVVSSGGNIGLGTASPSGKLDVRGNVYVSGNMGVGTTSPTNTVDVSGTLRVRTLNTGSGNFVTTDSSGVLQQRTASQVLSDLTAVTGVGTSGYVARWISNSGLATGIIYDNGTNVGIGTTSPSHRLHVSGTGNFTGDLYTSGNIGIGKTTPAYRLDVVGTGNFSQNLLVNGTGVSVSGHTHIGDDILIIADSFGVNNTILSSGSTAAVFLAQLNNNGLVEAIDSTATQIKIYQIEDFNSSVSGLLPVKDILAGTNISVSSSSGIYTINSTASGGSASISGVGVSGYVARWNAPSGLSSGIIYDNLSGVGIGTSSPTYRLDIASTGSNLLRIVDSSTNRFVFEKTSGNYSSLTTADNGGRKFAVASHPNDLATDVAYVAAVAQNVGAGATLSSPFNADSNHISIRARGDIVHFAALGGSVTERLRITSSGNVGIGNSSPAYRLDVTGTGNFTSNLYASGNLGIGTASPTNTIDTTGTLRVRTLNTASGNFVTTNSSGVLQQRTAAQVLSDLTAVTGVGSSGYVSRWISNSGLGTGIIYDNGTNVGIGTISPAYKLHVSGSFAATTKSFSIDHPSKPEMTLNYGSLESPYHGVRLTGRDSLSDGYCVVSLPDYIKDLVHDDDLNVQITNYKHGKILYVDSIDLNNNQFIVRCDSAYSNNLEFFWTFTGTRKDVDRLIVERTE